MNWLDAHLQTTLGSILFLLFAILVGATIAIVLERKGRKKLNKLLKEMEERHAKMNTKTAERRRILKERGLLVEEDEPNNPKP